MTDKNLKEQVILTKEQFEILSTQGSIVVNGQTIEYSPLDTIYMIANENLKEMVALTKDEFIELSTYGQIEKNGKILKYTPQETTYIVPDDIPIEMLENVYTKTESDNNFAPKLVNDSEYRRVLGVGSGTNYVLYYMASFGKPGGNGSLASYDVNGQLQTNAPTEDLDCTNKQYVDTKLLDKQDVLVAGKNINIDNNVVSGVPDEYDLIEEITIQEEVGAISRNIEPNGTPYNFKKVLLVLNIAKAEQSAVTGSLYVFINDKLSGSKSSVISKSYSSLTTFIITYEKINGFDSNFFQIEATNHNDSNANTNGKNMSFLYNSQNGIKKITLNFLTTSATFPVGTTLKIFGVKR